MALTNRINATFQTSECLPMPIINLCGKITAFDNICELKKCDESACELGLVGVCKCEWVCASASGCVQVLVGVCMCEQEKDTSREKIHTLQISLSPSKFHFMILTFTRVNIFLKLIVAILPSVLS